MSNLPPTASAAEPAGFAARPKTSRMAIASLVCGIVGPCTVGLASIAGIILGIVGLVKIGGSASALRGRGIAIAGIVVSVLGILILPLLGMFLAILMPAIFSAREAAYSASSANNVKQLCMTANQYAMSNRDKLPPADEWPAFFQKQMGLSSSVLSDPADEKDSLGYAMNAAIAGGTLAVPDPGRTVLFFECRPGAPPTGGSELLPDRPRHGGKYVIGFIDGHVEAVPPENVKDLIWQIKSERGTSEGPQ